MRRRRSMNGMAIVDTGRSLARKWLRQAGAILSCVCIVLIATRNEARAIMPSLDGRNIFEAKAGLAAPNGRIPQAIVDLSIDPYRNIATDNSENQLRFRNATVNFKTTLCIIR